MKHEMKARSVRDHGDPVVAPRELPRELGDERVVAGRIARAEARASVDARRVAAAARAAAPAEAQPKAALARKSSSDKVSASLGAARLTSKSSAEKGSAGGLAEAQQALRCLSLRFNLLRDDGKGSLLDRALEVVDHRQHLFGCSFGGG